MIAGSLGVPVPPKPAALGAAVVLLAVLGAGCATTSGTPAVDPPVTDAELACDAYEDAVQFDADPGSFHQVRERVTAALGHAGRAAADDDRWRPLVEHLEDAADRAHDSRTLHPDAPGCETFDGL